MKLKNEYLQAKIVTPVISIIVLLVYVISALKLAPPVVDGTLSESFFPLLVFILGAPTAVWLLMDALKEMKKEAAAGKEVVQKREKSIKPVLIVLLIALFIIGFYFLGFVLVAPLYVFVFMLIYDDKPQQFIKKAIYSIIISALVYVLYVVLFDIRFPSIWS